MRRAFWLRFTYVTPVLITKSIMAVAAVGHAGEQPGPEATRVLQAAAAPARRLRPLATAQAPSPARRQRHHATIFGDPGVSILSSVHIDWDLPTSRLFFSRS
jgi:hypothetical protein